MNAIKNHVLLQFEAFNYCNQHYKFNWRRSIYFINIAIISTNLRRTSLIEDVEKCLHLKVLKKLFNYI